MSPKSVTTCKVVDAISLFGNIISLFGNEPLKEDRVYNDNLLTHNPKKVKIKNQKSKIKNQKSKIKNQKLKIKNGKTITIERKLK